MNGTIRDQRTQTGPAALQTVADVRNTWAAYAAKTGMTLVESGATSRVYISAGCYVADCPNPDCNGAAAAWLENPDCACLSCGWLFTPAWPDQRELLAAVEILAHRPKPQWRNWRASNKDESLDDLKAQNLAFGDALPGGQAAAGPHPLDASVVR